MVSSTPRASARWWAKKARTTEGADAEFGRLAMHNFGAFIMGRHMFGAERGPWKDFSWKR